ncbi:hypothetical protein TRIP_D200005 [uncultured Paludibacter sp.]|nr:hypothetical protein TRIP_D200005 [uncultured Paludibacter sp.]
MWNKKSGIHPPSFQELILNFQPFPADALNDIWLIFLFLMDDAAQSVNTQLEIK